MGLWASEGIEGLRHFVGGLWSAAIRPALPLLLLVLVLIAGVVMVMNPVPPHKLVIATGPNGGGFQRFGEDYKRFLEPYGIEVALRSTKGGDENLRLLREGKVDVGFVQDGLIRSEKPADSPLRKLVSLGQISPQPLWIFYNKARAKALNRPMRVLEDLRGLRVNLGEEGSGGRVLMQTLLDQTTTGQRGIDVVASGDQPALAAQRLVRGELEVMVWSTSPGVKLLHELLQDPEIGLFDVAFAEAYARLIPEVRPLTLPEGLLDLQSHRPDHDIRLLSTSASLLVPDELHPALSALLVSAARQIHAGSGWFQRRSEFPRPESVDFPLDPDAAYVYRHGPSRWERWLPFWAANLVDRLGLMLLSMALILVPLVRFAPRLYILEVRWRIYRGYRMLKHIDESLAHSTATPAELLHQINGLDAQIARLTMPSWNSSALYALRSHIALVQRNLQAALSAQTTQSSGKS